jgi:hypothetical protein
MPSPSDSVLSRRGRRRRRVILGAVLALASVNAAGPDSRVAAQVVTGTRAPGDVRLRVFLDCPTGGCDRRFLVDALPYAIWTQDRLDADVHLLVTRLGNGAGGRSYTLQFIAQRRLGTGTDTLAVETPPNASDDMIRRALLRAINLGLVSDAARFIGAERFDVVYDVEGSDQSITTVAADDRWNLWVYRVDLRGNGSAESRSSEYELSTGFRADRVTETWKLSIDLDQSYEANRFTLSSGEDREFVLRRADADTRVVRSLSDHWSLGSRVQAGFSEFRNQDAFGVADVSAEYNLFPWREATSRQLVALVALGARHFDYREETIFGRVSETRPLARVVIAGESRMPWGTLDGAVRYRQYLHDGDRYNVSFFARTEFRVSRGLRIELSANAATVQDQLFLPRGGASDDEVLTRQRALATDYELRGSIGISYTFGSIYNTIVNPRLDRIAD